MAVEVNVPGERTAEFHLGQPAFTANESVRTLEVPVTNTGNVLVKPAGTLTILDSLGAEVMSADVAMGSVYAGMETVFQVSVPMQFALGSYTVTVDLIDESTGVSASLSDAKAELTSPLAEAQPTFAVNDIAVAANADPIQYVNVTATISNPLQAIPTANITLVVTKDGDLLEEFSLGGNLAIANGETPFEARYIPKDGWTTGTYSFTFEITSINVSDNSETVLASIDVTDQIVVP
jgi:hypothetical protein